MLAHIINKMAVGKKSRGVVVPILLYREARMSISWESCLNGEQKGFGERETQVTTQPS